MQIYCFSNEFSFLLYFHCFFLVYDSIVGGAVLVAGLYSVLWGKSREAMESEAEGKEEQKDDAAKASSMVEQA
jgi:hypothetical protein